LKRTNRNGLYNREACSLPDVTDWVITRAAAVAIIAAGSTLEWAASPGVALLVPLVDAAAGLARGAAVGAVTDEGWWWGGRWRRWASCLEGIGSLHGDATSACGFLGVTLHPDVAVFTPAGTVRVPDEPVVLAVL
jgi:hypothetical protein